MHRSKWPWGSWSANTLILPSSPILLYMVSGRDCTTPRLCVTSAADLHYVRSLSDCWCCMRSSGCHKVSIVNILRAGSSINVRTAYSRPASDLCTRAECWKKERSKIPRPSSLLAVNVLCTLLLGNSLSVSARCCGRWKPHNHYLCRSWAAAAAAADQLHTRQQQQQHKKISEREKKKSPVIYV